MCKKQKFSWGLLSLIVFIYVLNSSRFSGLPDGELTLVSHRGVHQTFSREDLTHETCTAERIFPPKHAYIENTIESLRAAHQFGAEFIEIDIHPTIDGEFVVFHDWTLDCRTEGRGRVRDQALNTLKKLDIGYGYTADGGITYPLRGQYIGGMPTLNEVLDTFQNVKFIINIKSRSKSEAQKLLSYLDDKHMTRLSFSGHTNPLSEIQMAYPETIVLSRAQSKQCLKGYVLTAWLNIIPKACHNTYVPVPSNYRWIMWGWPHKFEKRLNRVGSRSLLMGPYVGTGSTGIDSLDMLAVVPKDYKGLVWTNKIEVMGPALK